MTPEAFLQLVRQRTDLDLLGLCLHDAEPPFVFETKPVSWDTFREALTSNLPITREDIRIVGSARLGFSMRPGRNLRLFADTSDIDLVVVNAALFDELWGALLTAAYPRHPITGILGGWLVHRRNEIYTGWLSPPQMRLDKTIFGAKATPVLEFRTKWFNALKEASRHPPRRHEDIQGRLYRTWRHAELYHLHSLGELRRSLSL